MSAAVARPWTIEIDGVVLHGVESIESTIEAIDFWRAQGMIVKQRGAAKLVVRVRVDDANKLPSIKGQHNIRLHNASGGVNDLGQYVMSTQGVAFDIANGCRATLHFHEVSPGAVSVSAEKRAQPRKRKQKPTRQEAIDALDAEQAKLIDKLRSYR